MPTLLIWGSPLNMGSLGILKGDPMRTDHRALIRSCYRPRLVDITRNLMRESGLTQKELAARYGISRSAVEDLMADKHCPSSDLCQRIYEDLTGRPLLLIEHAAKKDGPH